MGVEACGREVDGEIEAVFSLVLVGGEVGERQRDVGCVCYYTAPWLDAGGAGDCRVEQVVLVSWAVGQGVQGFCACKALRHCAVGEAEELDERGLGVAEASDGAEFGVSERYVRHYSGVVRVCRLSFGKHWTHACSLLLPTSTTCVDVRSWLEGAH